jgi:hypothetical protein
MAIQMAFGFCVQPDKDKKEYLSGWTRAFDEEDAMEKIVLRYRGVPKEQIKIWTSGETWESFLREQNMYSGWD